LRRDDDRPLNAFKIANGHFDNWIFALEILRRLDCDLPTAGFFTRLKRAFRDRHHIFLEWPPASWGMDRGRRNMKSQAVKSLAVVVTLLAAMTWAKARSTANVVEDGSQVQVTANAGGGGQLPTRNTPLW
jgi:hypothetical protein